jgi:chromosomal replication initiation ATPase DnaA
LASQLILPLNQQPKLTRADFVTAPGNAQAVAFIDAWPDWPAPAAVLFGPAGSGKSHLAAIWQAQAGAARISAEGLAGLDPAALAERGPVAVEDVDAAAPSEARDRALFALIEGTGRGAVCLFTGREPPGDWPVKLPDLASRFAALLSFSLWAPDEALLAALARKLFTDRQLVVPDSVVQRMIRSLERSPAAIRDFVARADEKALAEGRPINLALVRELLVSCETGPP